MKFNSAQSRASLHTIWFSVLLVVVLLFMQYQSNQNIYRLQKNQEQSMLVLSAKLKMQEVLDYNNEAENIIRKFLLSKKSDTAVYLHNCFQLIDKGVAELKSMASFGKSKESAGQLSVNLEERRTFYKKVFNASYYDTEHAKTLLLSDASKNLSNKINFSANRLRVELERELQHVVTANINLTNQVKLLRRWLIVLAIAGIVIFGIIIIRHLNRNSRLIHDLEVANNKTNQAARAKEEFLANMSHEIRTPINSIIVLNHQLQKTTLTSQQQEFVELTNSACNSLLSIVNDILDLSKLEANMLTLERKPFGIHLLCHDLEKMFSQQAAQRGLSYFCYINKDVPKTVLGDKDRLNQVLTNLISNAIKFTDSGSVSVLVEPFDNGAGYKALRFVVKDTGIGIDPARHNIIFERFEQANIDTNRKYGGTGLGLAIVKRIITQHGGFIKVKSEPGAGAEFIFEIPYEPATTDISNSSVNSTKASSLNNETSLLGLRVLAVDDNKMNQTLLSFLLKQWKVDVKIAETGEQALTYLKEDNIDLVLLDVQLPLMDGYTTATKIRNELKSQVPIIAMTARAGEKEKCLLAGMNDYLSKPFDEDVLFALIETYAPKHSAVNTDGLHHPIVNMPYLNSNYSHNPAFISEVLLQFKEQYPSELLNLSEAIANKDFTRTRKWAHHLKTTVTIINNKSPLYDCCEKIESSANVANSWAFIEDELNKLVAAEARALKEIDILVENRMSAVFIK